MLKQLAEIRTSDFVLPGQRKDRPPSNIAMDMRRMKADSVTVHGFRSSFRQTRWKSVAS